MVFLSCLYFFGGANGHSTLFGLNMQFPRLRLEWTSGMWRFTRRVVRTKESVW